MSTDPTSLSSVTPRGTCTKGALRTMRVGGLPASLPGRVASHCLGLSGSALHMLSFTTSIGGSRACMPRARMDLQHQGQILARVTFQSARLVVWHQAARPVKC